MWTRQLLKENGKIAFKRNYWICVLVSFIIALTGGQIGAFSGSSGVKYEQTTYTEEALFTPEVVEYMVKLIPIVLMAGLLGLIIGIMVAAFVTNIFAIGGNRYYLENREHKTDVSRVVFGFTNGNYMNCVGIMLRKMLYILGWTLLFVIPGIVKSYAYMLIPYILAENPDISKERAFEISEQTMQGHKWEAFVLELSFLGWDILGIFTGGILNIFWVIPYKHATYAEFYTALKAEAFQKGITSAIEIPGVGYSQEEQVGV